MGRINILHISDVHWRPKDRESIGLLVGAVCRDLKVLMAAGTRPDMIVFSGDLVFSGADLKHFSQAYDEVLLRIMKTAGLDKTRLFICPGNHDIDRDTIAAYAEFGLKGTLINRDVTNVFLKDLSDGSANVRGVLDRLKNYNSFSRTLLSKPPNVFATPMLQVSRLEVADEQIGVAVFNTAWRCTGAPNDADRHQLILGEKMIDDALVHLSDCGVRIAVFHHPIDWLHDFDQASTLNLLYAEFDLIMHGHIHKALPEQRFTTSGTALFSQVGCLYENRDYPNSYQMITIDTEESEITFQIRTYFDAPRREFDAALNVAQSGVFARPFYLRRTADHNKDIRRFLRAASLHIRSKESEHLDMGGIFSTAGVEARATFVCPPLGKRKHSVTPNLKDGKSVEEAEERVSLEDLIRQDANVLFIAGRETGKTSLGNHIAVLISDGLSERDRVPLLIDSKSLKKGRRGVVETFGSYYGAHGRKVDCAKLLDNGDLTLIVDDIEIDTDDAITDLTKLVELFPGCRFFLLGSSSALIGEPVKEKLPESIQQVFIKPLPRRAIRELSKRWCHVLKIDDTETNNFVVKQVKENHLPRTGYIVALLIWAYQRQKRMERVNEAFLLNAIVDSLLEKADFTKALRREFDPVSAEITLQSAAVFLRDRGGTCSDNEFVEHLLTFFKQKELDFSAVDVFSRFVRCGIMTVKGSAVEFKYRCFQEYFYAKYLLENEKLRLMIVDEKASAFQRELYILSGLRRKNADILEVLQKRLERIAPEKLRRLGAADFAKIASQNVFDPTSHKKLSAIKTKRVTSDQVDDLLDATERELEGTSEGHNIAASDASTSAETPFDPDNEDSRSKSISRFVAEISLFGSILKNSEFDDAKLKGGSIRFYFDYMVRFLTYISLIMDEIVGHFLEEHTLTTEKANDPALTSEEKATLRAKVSLIMSRIMFTITSARMGDDVGTEKFGLTYLNLLKADDLPNETKLLVALVMFDIDQAEWEKHLSDMIDANNHTFMLDAVTERLWCGLNTKFEPERRRKKLTQIVDHITNKLEEKDKRPNSSRQRINQAANVTKARGGV